MTRTRFPGGSAAELRHPDTTTGSLERSSQATEYTGERYALLDQGEAMPGAEYFALAAGLMTVHRPTPDRLLGAGANRPDRTAAGAGFDTGRLSVTGTR